MVTKTKADELFEVYYSLGPGRSLLDPSKTGFDFMELNFSWMLMAGNNAPMLEMLMLNDGVCGYIKPNPSIRDQLTNQISRLVGTMSTNH